ncbi:MAG TPA: hypothetical protein VFD82_22230 [Planctomycetota bacterium]|nr:hypothetical protein [Planctomycetota bacterium]
MLVKGLVLTALVASTPLAFVATQDPRPGSAGSETTAASELAKAKAEVQCLEALTRKNAADLAGARRELEAARTDLDQLRKQLEQALDALDTHFEPPRDRNCSPSRSRALLTHYQWLRGNGHAQRAATTLAKVVEQTGDDMNQLNRTAWELMTGKETAGKFDEVALAYVARMQASGQTLDARQLDTAALANFLNGKIDQAVTLQQQAIEHGGRDEDFRRRLRTYEAAQAALVKAAAEAKLPATTTMVAGGDN